MQETLKTVKEELGKYRPEAAYKQRDHLLMQALFLYLVAIFSTSTNPLAFLPYLCATILAAWITFLLSQWGKFTSTADSALQAVATVSPFCLRAVSEKHLARQRGNPSIGRPSSVALEVAKASVNPFYTPLGKPRRSATWY